MSGFLFGPTNFMSLAPMRSFFPAHALPAVVNHLLAQEPAARGKLAQYAGSVARIETGVLTLNWQVLADGSIAARAAAPAAADVAPRVVIRIDAADLPQIALHRERAFSYVKVEGDAEFATVISQLTQSLRWDAELDLSRWIGDIAAVRVVAGTRSALAFGLDTGRRLAENVAEYLLEEQPVLMRPGAIADWSADVVELRNDAERLLKRIEKIETKLSAGAAAASAPSAKLDKQ